MNIKKSLFYNVAYQVLIVFIPLITSPYLARTIGAEGVGIYSYTYSIAFYFMIFAMMGISNYGNRSVAKVNDADIRTYSRVFWSIYCIQFCLSVVAIVAYILYILVFAREYIAISWLQGMYVLSYALDITWFFYGMEKFAVIVLKNTTVKLMTLVAILTLVRTKADVWIYVAIMAGGTLLGQMITWPQAIRILKFEAPRGNEVKLHIKPIVVLFIPVLAISIFAFMDKIMLGQMSNMIETGYYENSEKIISIPKAMITAIGTVMLPRTANLLAHGDEDKVLKTINVTMSYVLCAVFACAFGLIAVGRKFSIVFWGESFTTCGAVIACLSPALVFSVFGNVIRTQYLIPKEMDNAYVVSLVLGALINLVVNYLLIPQYGSFGAAMGTVAAEFGLCAYQTWSARRQLNIGGYLLRGLPFLAFGVVMYGVVNFIDRITPVSTVWLLAEIVAGGVAYLALALLFLSHSRDEANRELWSFIVNILRKVRLIHD